MKNEEMTAEYLVATLGISIDEANEMLDEGLSQIVQDFIRGVTLHIADPLDTKEQEPPTERTGTIRRSSRLTALSSVLP